MQVSFDLKARGLGALNPTMQLLVFQINVLPSNQVPTADNDARSWAEECSSQAGRDCTYGIEI